MVQTCANLPLLVLCVTLRYPALLCSYASPRLPGPPGGAPAAATNSPKAQHVKDARGDGFSTTLQPAAKAGATLSTSGLGIGPNHINQLFGDIMGI